ncbi:hypothetical protein AB0P04_41055, partial [Streptomyces anulatus]
MTILTSLLPLSRTPLRLAALLAVTAATFLAPAVTAGATAASASTTPATATDASRKAVTWHPPVQSRWQYQLEGNPAYASTGGVNVDICVAPKTGGACVRPEKTTAASNVDCGKAKGQLRASGSSAQKNAMD